jgi:hypothetical protein
MYYVTYRAEVASGQVISWRINATMTTAGGGEKKKEAG